MHKMNKFRFTFVNLSCYSMRIIIHLIQITNKTDPSNKEWFLLKICDD